MSRGPAAALLVLSAVTTAAACRPRGELAVVTPAPGLAERPNLYQLGRRWNAPGAAAGAIGADGRIEVPSGRSVVVPFVDLNGNRRLDKLVEPSADCGRKAGFRCRLDTANMYVRRLQRREGSGEPEDTTFILAEAYRGRPLAPDADAQLCRPDTGDCQGRTEHSPYADVADALAFKLCDFNDSAFARDGSVPIELRSGGRAVLNAKIPQPPAVNLRTTLTRDGKEIVVTGEADVDLDRAVVWLAGYDRAAARMGTVVWSTEEAPEGALRMEGRRFVARIPAERLRACAAGCRIGVQAASDLQVGAVAISTEGAALLSTEAGS